MTTFDTGLMRTCIQRRLSQTLSLERGTNQSTATQWSLFLLRRASAAHGRAWLARSGSGAKPRADRSMARFHPSLRNQSVKIATFNPPSNHK